MCGIAGYSLGPDSTVDRTVAARALLAGIAERGADAVGFAYRSERAATTHKQRSGASALLDRITVPADAMQVLVHVRDYTKGHPSLAANNHPIRHGAVVGIHNGVILNDDELLAEHDCARREPGMTVDSEAIFAVAAHSEGDAAKRPKAAPWFSTWVRRKTPGTTSMLSCSVIFCDTSHFVIRSQRTIRPAIMM